MAGDQERFERHGGQDRGKLDVDEIIRLFKAFKDLLADNRSDLTKEEAKKLIANAQPTLDALKDIQGS